MKCDFFIKTVTKKALKFITFLFSLFIYIGCLLPNFQKYSTTSAATANKLVVGTNATFQPFEYIDNGQIVGFDIDLIKEIIKRLGLTSEVIDMNFDSLIPSLGPKIDIAAAAITKNEERSKVVDFTESYYTAIQYILTLKDRHIEKEDDLKNLILASQTGTTAQDIVNNIEKKFNQQKSKTYNDYLTMVNDLIASRIDVIVLDKNTALAYEKMYPDKIKAIDGKKFNFTEENYCFACPKNKPELLASLNDQIVKLKNEGTFLAELTKKYISPIELGQNVTNAPISQATPSFKTINEGVLTIGTNATLHPFEYVKDGQIVGFDIDLIKEIAKLLGFSEDKVKIIDMGFDALIPSIGTKIDIAIAAITKNEERAKVVAFSKDYFTTQQNILTLKDKKLEKEEDLKGLTLATQMSTTAQDIVNNIEKKFNQQKSKAYNDYLTMVNDLIASRVDAIVLDRNTALTYEKLYPKKLKVIDGKKFNFAEESYSIACAKDNIQLQTAIDAQIDKLKSEGKFFEELTQKHINQQINEISEPENAAKERNENSLKNQIKIAIFDNDRWKLYIGGLGVTIQITIFAAILGFIIGIAIALIRIINLKGAFNILKILSKIYVDVLRGTPLLVQLLILWFVILQNSKNPILVAIIACGLNSGAYVSEIIRGAMSAIDKGQTEAGLSMGFSPLQTLMYIVLPQGLKNAIPTLCNEVISLLKETAIVGYISVIDLTRAADLVRASTYQAFVPLIFIATIYFVITKIASLLLSLLERKQN